MAAERDYQQEINIAKSINWFLKSNVFPTWNWTGHSNQFHYRYPIGTFTRPAVCTEYQHARRSDHCSIGRIPKQRTYQITVFGISDQHTENLEELLMEYKNQAEVALEDAVSIPYYRFDHNAADPPQMGSFQVYYAEDRVASEAVQKDKNTAIITIMVK